MYGIERSVGREERREEKHSLGFGFAFGLTVAVDDTWVQAGLC